MKRPPSAPDVAALPGTPAHGFFLAEDDVTEVHEHGERADAAPREDSLIGTAGSHAPSPDLRAEEPSAAPFRGRSCSIAARIARKL